MNTSAANTSTGSPPRKPALGAGFESLERALRPQSSPMVIVVRAANAVRDLCRVGRAGARYISATEVQLEGGRMPLKRSAVGNRRWELAQSVRSLRAGRRAA